MTASEFVAARIGSSEQTGVHSEVLTHLLVSSYFPSHFSSLQISAHNFSPLLLLPEKHLLTAHTGSHSYLCQVMHLSEGSHESPSRCEGKSGLSEPDLT